MKETLTIGISGPINLQLLNWQYKNEDLPETNEFPLTSHLINALLKRGYNVIGYTNSNTIAEPLVLQDGNLTVCIGRTKPQPGRRIFKFEREELKMLMLNNPADVIYGFWSYEYSWAALDSGIPTIVSVHDIARRILLTQPDIFRFVRWLMNFVVVHKASHLAPNSSYTYKQLSRSDQKKALIINNFYASDFEKSIPKTTHRENCIVSVCMGFTKRKGVPVSLQAFALLREKYPDLEYRLIGVGMEQGGEAHQYAAQHNMTAGVKFMGSLPIDQVLQQVAQAKVLVHASVEESFGMAVLEAMVMGTPVVGGDKSGFIPQLLDNGKAGLLCDISSPEAIADTTDRLLSDNAFAQEIATKAAEFAKTNFSEDVVIEQFLEYVRSLLHKNKIHKGIEEVAREVA
ncbi:glycosyltransferase family 4 protein [Pontibacter sp. MBLB2868]|uniref:glycosyltransferase family 4 protein n=1 Tax=Pontibacter sp. MBLB2868 TaxID=3451555 RepID=UPI003F7510B0